METVNNTGKIIAVAAGAITVDEIKDSIKGGKEAQIRQKFAKAYPSQKTSNEFKDSLFSNEELEIETTDYTEERVTWIPVGENHTKADVKKKLASVPDATIYKILSHSPIVTSDQQRVLDNGLTGDALTSFLKDNKIKGGEWTEKCSEILYNKIADRQRVVYGEDNDQDKPADEAVLYNGKEQYREVFFSLTARPDMDLRGGVVTKQEMPELVLTSAEVEEQVEA